VGIDQCRPSGLQCTLCPRVCPLSSIQLGGIGQPWNPSPLPGCFPVFIASDSPGQAWPPLSELRRILAQVAPGLTSALIAQSKLPVFNSFGSPTALCAPILWSPEPGARFKQDGEVVIDMDAVADARGQGRRKASLLCLRAKPAAQIHLQDLPGFKRYLGRFGYCSLCGTRNDLADFEKQTVPTIRSRLNSGNSPEDCVRDAVASFDSFMAQVAKQLAKMVPLTERRRYRLLTQSFHNLAEIRATFKNWFDIDVCAA